MIDDKEVALLVENVSFDFRFSRGESPGSWGSAFVLFTTCIVGMVRVEGRLTTGLIDDTAVDG